MAFVHLAEHKCRSLLADFCHFCGRNLSGNAASIYFPNRIAVWEVRNALRLEVWESIWLTEWLPQGEESLCNLRQFPICFQLLSTCRARKKPKKWQEERRLCEELLDSSQLLGEAALESVRQASEKGRLAGLFLSPFSWHVFLCFLF